jgi:polar amino acid transport system substrate-binding protein
MARLSWAAGATAVLLAALALARGAGAEPPRASVRVVTERFPPYNFEEHGVVKGAATEVVRAVLERAGLDGAIEVLPWKRALDAALHESGTLIYSVARTQGRERQLLWLGKLCDRKLVLYCLKGRSDLLGHPLSELPDATVALIQGDASEELLRGMGLKQANLRLFRDADPPNSARHVLEGRSDFFVSNPLRFAYGERGTDLEGRFQEHSVLWQGDGYYLAANPASNPELIARVREAYASLQAEGSLQPLFERALARLAR